MANGLLNYKEGGLGAEACARGDWAGAYAALHQAPVPQLDGSEVARLALVAHLLGYDGESQRAWETAHHLFLSAGKAPAAARCAFWLARALMEAGEMAPAGGWLGRAQSVLDEWGLGCPERGYIQIPRALELLESGDHRAASRIFEELRALGREFGDRDLLALGSLGGGRCLMNAGEAAEGLAKLDEVMVSVVSGEVSPLVAGTVYCAVIEACHEVFDFRRGREWTAALTRWCDDQPGLVPFRGECQVYRSELMALSGEWESGIAAAEEAERRMSAPPPHPALGSAYYIKGELNRLRGAVADADEAFQRAEECGRRPEPGRALLRLAQGRPEAAANAIRHALDEAADDAGRGPLLSAAVEIFTAQHEAAAAESAARELEELAGRVNAPWLRAAAARAKGVAAMSAGEPATALPLFRAALGEFQALGAPYEAARTRLLFAEAARLTGDSDTAAAQLDSSRKTFAELGAAPELARLGRVSGSREGADALTARELEVLRLVSRGLTNRAIAASLTISEKTAANHVANILGKLGLSSRSAATAFAYEHDLV